MSKSRYVDIPSTMQVIGGIYIKPSLIDSGKYTFNEEDFTEEFHKILFGSIYNLHVMGIKEINPDTIEDYLSSREKKLSTFKVNNGKEYLNKLKETTRLTGFDYYYNRMKKMTLLRMYNEKAGMDLSYLYDKDNILDIKKKQKQEDWLDNNSLSQIATAIDNQIEKIKLKYIDDAENAFSQAGAGANDLIDQLMQFPEIGVPLYGPIINSITKGARLGKLYLRSAATGVGKALPNSTVIPTPTGLKTVGEIKVGDYLFDGLGKPTLVRAIYPQGKKEVWEVTFKDGRKAKCCEEHLWSYCSEGQRKEYKLARKFQTKTLKEINEIPLYKDGHGYQILVPMQQAVKYSTKQYYLPPYTFGLLLGDGSFRYNETQKALQFSSENDELPSAIAKEMNWNYKKNSEFNYTWTFEWNENKSHKNVWVKEALKDYPILWQRKSEMKFIPKEYLEGDIEQRFDLLNGLLDSDGSIDKNKGRVSFWTTSEQLRNDVITLAWSLGFKTSCIIDERKDSLTGYKIEIIGRPEDKIKLFKLKRKHDLIMQWFSNGKRKELNLFNPIIKIEKLDYEEEMTCFYVDNPEHLFLTNDFIVTHNTRSMIADCCNIGCNRIYDTTLCKWVDNGTKEPCVFITTEQQLDEIQTMMLAFLSGVNEDHILDNKYGIGELERVRAAAAILEASPIYIKRLPDFSLQDIENTIKFGISEYNARYFFHDYIHSSMKILSEVSGKSRVEGLKEYNVLFMIAVRLKDLCVEHGIFIETATQLNSEYRNSNIYDQNLLRGAKSIADKIDFGSIMLEITSEDRESLSTLIQNNGFEIPSIKMSVYKNRRGKYKDVLLWCKADRGICRIEPIFVTDYLYNIIDIPNLKINVVERE